MAGKKQNMAPMWNKLMKDVDLDEPTSFLDHENLGCTQRECKPNEAIVEQHRDMNHVLLPGATEKLPGCENLTRKQLRGPTTWKDMLKNALKDVVTCQNCTKFQPLAWTIINSRKRNLNQLEKCLKYAHNLS